MIKIHLILSFTFFGLFTACNTQLKSVKTSPKQVQKELVYLDGYFTKNNLEFETSIKYLLIRNQHDFNRYFGMAPLMGETILGPDFNAINIGAIITQSSSKGQAIDIKNCTGNYDHWTITYSHDFFNDQTYSSDALVIFEVPKSIKSITFITGKENTIVE